MSGYGPKWVDNGKDEGTEYDEYEVEITLTRVVKAKDDQKAEQLARKMAHGNFGGEFKEPHFELSDVETEKKE